MPGRLIDPTALDCKIANNFDLVHFEQRKMKTQEILKYPLNFGFITTTLNRNKQEICKKLHKNVFSKYSDK